MKIIHKYIYEHFHLRAFKIFLDSYVLGLASMKHMNREDYNMEASSHHEGCICIYGLRQLSCGRKHIDCISEKIHIEMRGYTTIISKIRLAVNYVTQLFTHPQLLLRIE